VVPGSEPRCRSREQEGWRYMCATNMKLDEACLWRCHWRGEEGGVRQSDRKRVLGGPEKDSLWHGHFKRG